MFAQLIPAAASLMGGGAKGGSADGPTRQSQDGSQLSSGTGEFSVGGGPPKWFWPVGLGLALVVGLFIWKPWKA